MIRLVLLLLLLLAPLADAAELKLATWNLEWLTARPAGDPALPSDVVPKRPEDVARLRQYAADLNADVIAMQEVDGPAMAARIFPPDRYAIHMTQDRVVQRVGIAVRRGIPFTVNPDLVGLDVYPHARYTLRSGADVTLKLPGGFLRVLAVHLKSGCFEGRLTYRRNRACETLARQVPPLRGWIAERRAEGVPFVIMGDFNRRMDIRDPFFRDLERSAPLALATEGRLSPCWGGERFIDHIVAGGAARAWMQPQTLRVLLFAESGQQWKERLSDHCAVSVRFNIPDGPG